VWIIYKLSIHVFSSFYYRNNIHLFPPKLRHDLNGKVIKVGVVENPPALYRRIGGGFAGLDIEMIDAMASALNFKAQFFPASDLIKENDGPLAIPYKTYYGPWKTVMLRTIAGDVSIGIGGMLLSHHQIGDIGYTQIYARDNFEFFATNDPILSTRAERWIALVIFVMVFVLMSTSLPMNLLRHRSSREGEVDCGRTVIMVGTSHGTRCL